MIPVLEPCFQEYRICVFRQFCFCSLLSAVAGVVNALAVRRELHARREQGISCRGRTATGERILRERYEKFRHRRQH